MEFTKSPRKNHKFPNFPLLFFPIAFRFPFFPFPFVPFPFLSFPFFRFPSIRIPQITLAAIGTYESAGLIHQMAILNSTKLLLLTNQTKLTLTVTLTLTDAVTVIFLTHILLTPIKRLYRINERNFRRGA